jgi:hypothetical protein
MRQWENLLTLTLRTKWYMLTKMVHLTLRFLYQLRDANYRKQLRETGVREGCYLLIEMQYDTEWLTKNFLLNSPDLKL